VRILVVDDEAFAADALAVLLNGRGHEVIVAHDGSEGITKGIAGAFDAAVVDLAMPTVDGYEVARALRAHHGDILRLVAYTGFSGANIQREAHANGFNRVIVKPATIESILSAVNERGSAHSL
jgi:CheY-like chemotaxis protein